MKKEKKMNIKVGMAMTLIIIGMLCASVAIVVLSQKDEILYPMKINENDLIVDEEPEVEWVKIATIKLSELGEASPGSGASGWLETFILDYGETPETYLEYNTSFASPYGVANNTVRGYVDADAQTIDLASEDPGYFVVRGRFNITAQDGGSWNYSRFKAELNLTGDETFGPVEELDNSTTASGGDAVISSDESDWLFINFWWDDADAGANGFRITDDGQIDWEVTLWAKY